MSLSRWMLIAVSLLLGPAVFGAVGPARTEDPDEVALRTAGMATDDESLLVYLP